MSFPILVETREGRFAASVAGVPNLIAVESTRSQAIAALRQQILQLIELGELLTLEVEDAGVSGLAGKYGDDETLAEICADIYRRRDADRGA
jgi:hypothetical protein